MKKYILLSVTLTLLVVGACQDKFLDLNPQTGQITSADVFKDRLSFDAFLFGAYSEMQGFADGTGVTNWIILPGYVSQDMTGSDETTKDLGSFMTTSNVLFSNYWSTFYKIATKSNVVLDALTTAPSSIPDSAKAQIGGEARFLRGFAYFMLARAYGNIPMPLVSYDQSQNNLECTPEAQVFDQVIKDLTDAAQKLPTRAGWGANNLGRATRESALAYLANAYMYKKDWPNAAKASQDLMALGEHRLLPDVRRVFSETNENTEESIFEVQYRDISDGVVAWGVQPENGNVLDEWGAPRNIGDQYATAGGWGETVLKQKVASSFEPGDDRRKKLMVTIGDKYKGERMKDTLVIPASVSQPKSAFSTKFWLGPEKGYFNGQNVSVMRYAEFLLNYAEILFEQGKSADAYTQLNLVRSRAKLPAKAGSSDRETFMTALMKERHSELIYEPNLWFHYTRTGRAAKFVQDEYGVTFNPNWNKFPVPQGDRDQNPKLCQNPGY